MTAVGIPVERATGINTGFRQVTDTISFEMKRNLKKAVLFGIVEAILFVVLTILYEFLTSTGFYPEPDNAGEFIAFYFSSLSFYNLFLSFMAIILGAACIAQDYEKQTGHQLFPRISRGRLLLGRVIGLYILYAVVIGLYYLLIGIYAAIKFAGAVPIEFLWSLGFALFFGIATLSFVILLSSLMNTGGAFGLGIGIVVFAPLMLEQFLPMLFKIEPVFLLSYYFKILPNIFNMPLSSCAEAPNPYRPSTNMLFCSTPTVGVALLGMLIYTVACLGFAYLRFRTRQLIS